MLGRYADQFFHKQTRERVVAQAANGLASSLTYPDRGDRGTGQVHHVPGHYEMPGPQTAVDANAVADAAAASRDMLPGMGQAPRDMLPGMGQEPRDMLPGMGQSPRDMLPGMGFIDQIPGGWWTVAGVSLVGYLALAGGRRRGRA